ncbi:MAG: alpha/beta hydrolase, partial [Thermoplasmata archaeon]
YDFDELVTEDIPAVIAAVCYYTGSQKVQWVGHSMGAASMLAFLSTDARVYGQENAGFCDGAWRPLPPNAVVSVVALGGFMPLNTTNKGYHIAAHAYLDVLVDLILDKVPLRLLANIVNDRPEIAGPVSTKLFCQFAQWVRAKNETDKLGWFKPTLNAKVNSWWAMFNPNMPGGNNVEIPVSFGAGDLDTSAPIASSMTAYNALVGPKDYKIFYGYNHGDLIFGANAHIDIFPWVEAELLEYA